MTDRVKMIFPAEDVLGEGAVWDEARQRLLWVDIIGRRIHRLDPLSGAHETWPTPEFVTSIGLRRDGGAVVGLTRTVALWEFGGEFKNLANPEPQLPGNRLNEGRVGPDGAFWVGTMQNNFNVDGTPRALTETSGAIYRIEPDGSIDRLTMNVFGLTNTMVWTADSRFMVADTRADAIYYFPYDQRHHRFGGMSLFTGPFSRGLPDGSCLDAEGYLWNCRTAGGACVVRFAPDGSVDRIVELPCSWPTSCAFGGPDYDTLFVTSARFTMSEEHLQANPHEGSLLALQPGVRGLPEHLFGNVPGAR